MDEELSPEHAERMRRLLADARHTDPMPTEVADRLDRALAEVAAGRDDQPVEQRETLPGVTPLAQRRRRAGRLLLAAAAVVVGGVAVAQLGSSDGGMESVDRSTSQNEGLAAPKRDADEGEVPEAAAGDQAPGAVADSQIRVTKGPARTIRPGHFVRDARRARISAVAAGDVARADGLEARPQLRSQYAARDRAGCRPEAAWGGGRYVPVSYGRSGGWLLIRPPLGDTQVVDLFLCGEDSAVRSATLPFH